MRFTRPLPPAAAALVLVVTACGPDTAPPAPAPSPPPSAEADPVVELMTDLARTQEALPEGEVWHLRTEFGLPYGAGPEGNRYGVHGLDLREEWVRLSDGMLLERNTEYDWKLVSPAGEAAWAADGSPTSWESDFDLGRPSVPGEPRSVHEVPGELGAPEPGEFQVDQQYHDIDGLRSLPTSPEGMAGLFPPEEETGHPVGHTAYTVGRTLEDPVTPQIRSALYLRLAEIEGARVLEEAEDRAGRPSVGVAFPDEGDEPHGTDLEARLFFDPETGMPRSLEFTVVEPSPLESQWLSPGDVYNYWLYEEIGWTDDWPL